MTIRRCHAETTRRFYNQARHDLVVEAVRKGNYRATAARIAGVSPWTLRTWLEEGEIASADEIAHGDPRARYRKLFEDVEEAEAQFEAEMVSRVVTAADEPKNWPAAMTILERTRPHKFGRRDTTVVEGGDKPIQNVTLAILADPGRLEAANEVLVQLARPTASALEPR